MILDDDELAQAIVFFDDDRIIKEMHYAEFEAILDGFVPAFDLASQKAKAVFIEIDSKYRLHTSVFFCIQFNRKGEIDSGWNLPLQQIANMAMRGPDLGAGPIRLACKSQCPIQYFQQSLWDPDLRAGKGHLNALKKAVERNRLAVQFRQSESDSSGSLGLGQPQLGVSTEQLELKISQELRKEYAKEFRDHMAQVLKDQRLRTTTIHQEGEERIQALKLEHNQRIEEYRSLLEDKDRTINEERLRNQSLKETIDGQVKKIEGLREYFEHKLEQAEGQERDVAHVLRNNFEVETEAKIEAATKELKEMLQMREVEMLYRNEQETQLKDEIARLRQQNQELTNNSGDHLLDKMKHKGISFVTFQPGAGHITIPTVDIPRFMENPVAYAADQCGVKESHYSAWLQHYQAPVCSATDENGKICGENITRCESPTDFLMGDGDRCDKHKEFKGSGKLKIVSG